MVSLIELKRGDWLKFGGNNVDLGRKYMRVEYTHKPVSLPIGSEAPCCGGGLSGNRLPIIHFIF